MPKLEPLKEFICDQCGQIIEEPGDGWVEWLAYWEEQEGHKVVYNFRIVHQQNASPLSKGSCYYTDLNDDYEGAESSNHLNYFLEDQGIAEGLDMLQKSKKGDLKFRDSEDYIQLLDLIRRVSIPYYEEGRKYLDRYYAKWTGESEIDYTYLNSKNMRRFLNWIEEKEYDYDFR